MRLADFILENIEPILVDWVSFARTITPEKDMVNLKWENTQVGFKVKS